MTRLIITKEQLQEKIDWYDECIQNHYNLIKDEMKKSVDEVNYLKIKDCSRMIDEYNDSIAFLNGLWLEFKTDEY